MPRQTPNSQQVAQRTAASGDSPGFVAGDAGTFEDYNHPIYFSSRRDPAYRVKCLEFGGTCEVRNQRVRIPRFATAAGGSDGHLGVISQDLRWGYDFWQVRERPEAGGALRVSYGGRTPSASGGRTAWAPMRRLRTSPPPPG